MDFTKIENIIFVSVLGALCALFLATVIAVCAKGKRPRRAVDVVLRVFAVLVFIIAAALFVCSIMTELDGSFRIDLSDAQAIVTVGAWSQELPLLPLFAALATAVGRYLSLGLAVLALVALIVDCALCKKKKKAAAKTPEQLKREKEIERIRKLADAAVEKSSVAATEKPKADEPAPAETASAAEENFDWRVDKKDEQKSAEFVGLSDTANADFDDSFDSDDLEESAAQSEIFDEQAETPERDEQPEESAEGEDDIPFYAEGSFTLDSDETEEENTASSEAETDDYALVKSAESEADSVYTDDSAQPEPDIDPGFTLRDDVDRNFYIPGIRTIVRSAPPEPKEKKPTARRAQSGKPTGKKPAEGSSTQTKPRAAAKKPAPSKKPQTEKAAAKPTGGQPAAQRTASDKLPVTRRYVIIDRKNAVNVFSDYLKQRDKDEKDRLTGSINKIIIK